VSVSVTDNGVQAWGVTNNCTVKVTEVNVAPVLSVPADQTIDEQTSLSVSASATDADLPANTLTFALVSAPLGMSINPASGVISWTPSEAQDRRSTRLSASQQINAEPAFCVTKNITVTVREVN